MFTAVVFGNIHTMPTPKEIKTLVPDVLLHETQGLRPKLKQRNLAHNFAYFLLAQLLQKSGQSISLLNTVTKTKSGRPFIPNAPHIDFNISHSADWVAVILQINNHANSNAVAIDIEAPQKERNYNGLLNYYASEKERLWFMKQNNKCHAFYLTWCCREAVLKSQGVGIAKLQSVIVDPEEKLILSEHAPVGKLYHYDKLPFYLAYFITETETKIQIYHWEFEQCQAINLPPQRIFSVNPLSHSKDTITL